MEEDDGYERFNWNNDGDQQNNSQDQEDSYYHTRLDGDLIYEVDNQFHNLENRNTHYLSGRVLRPGGWKKIQDEVIGHFGRVAVLLFLDWL